MKEIDISKIRGKFIDYDGDKVISGGDDTIESIKMVAEKVNEIIRGLEPTQMKEEKKCCKKCFGREPSPSRLSISDVCYNPECPCHTPKKESWEEAFDKEFVWFMTTDDHDVVAHYNEEERKLEFWNDYKIKNFIRQTHLDLLGEIESGVMLILTDEIATAHTTKSGKTSRLTSAYNRIVHFINSKKQ